MKSSGIGLTTEDRICIAANTNPLPGTTTRVISINYNTERKLKNNPLKDISKFVCFEFDFNNKGIRAWEAWGIGSGHFFPAFKFMKSYK